MAETSGFDATKTRETLRRRGMAGQVIRYAYRPFDLRWLYWEAETALDQSRRVRPHVLPGNIFLSAGENSKKSSISLR
jgi:hypothetical protein